MERNQNLCSRSPLPSFATLRTHHTRAKPPPKTGRLPPQASQHRERGCPRLTLKQFPLRFYIACNNADNSPRRILSRLPVLLWGQETFTLQTASHGKAFAFRQRDSAVQTLHFNVLPSLKLHSRWGARVLMTLRMTLRRSCGWLSSLALIFRWYWWGSAVQSRIMPKLLSAFWLMTLADWPWHTKLPLDSAHYASAFKATAKC